MNLAAPAGPAQCCAGKTPLAKNKIIDVSCNPNPTILSILVNLEPADGIAHWTKADKEIQQDELLTGQLSGSD